MGRKLSTLSLEYLSGPNHKNLGFEKFILKCEQSVSSQNRSRSLTRFSAKETSETNTVVSSAYCVIFISSRSKLKPIMAFVCLTK